MPLPLFREPKQPLKIAVAAGKGGVGKSTLTVQLAQAMQLLGKKVGVLDTDLYGPSIRRMLPEDRLPKSEGEQFVPALCRGIPVMSMAYFRQEGEAAVMRAPIANGLIKRFLQNITWPEIDILLIDFPPGTGDIQLTLGQSAAFAGAVMVTTPQEIAVMDVRKAIDLFRQVNVPILGIVENMSYYINPVTGEPDYLFGRDGGERLARENGVPLLGRIPLDKEIARSGDSGLPLPDESMKSFLTVAENALGHLESLVSTERNSLGSFELRWS